MCVNGETMVFDPLPVVATVPLVISITGDTAYVDVGLSLTGPGTASVQGEGVTGTGPYTWGYRVTDLVAGHWFATFPDMVWLGERLEENIALTSSLHRSLAFAEGVAAEAARLVDLQNADPAEPDTCQAELLAETAWMRGRANAVLLS